MLFINICKQRMRIIKIDEIDNVTEQTSDMFDFIDRYHFKSICWMK
jgi:hypothetical protein